MQNYPTASETHLVGNGGENLFVINYGRGSNVVLYPRGDSDFIDTLDLRPITRQFNRTQIRIIPPNEGNHLEDDVLITLGFPEIQILLKNGTYWCKDLQVITDVAPQKIVGAASPPYLDYFRLEPIPLEFGEQKIIVVSVNDVEPETKIIMHRDYDQHVFFRDADHLRLTNTLNLFPRTQSNTLLFANYFKEPKLSTLSIQFANNVTLMLNDKQAEINRAPDFETQLVLRKNVLETLAFAAIEQTHPNGNNSLLAMLPASNASYASSNETETNEIFRRRRSIPSTIANKTATETGLRLYQAKASEALVIGIPLSSLTGGAISGVCNAFSEQYKQYYPRLPRVMFYGIKPTVLAMGSAAMNSVLAGSAESIGLEEAWLSFAYYFR